MSMYEKTEESVFITARVLRTTDKAIRIATPDRGGHETACWIPKSQILQSDPPEPMPGDEPTMEISGWIADVKGLI